MNEAGIIKSKTKNFFIARTPLFAFETQTAYRLLKGKRLSI